MLLLMFSAAALTVIALVMITNVLWFPRLRTQEGTGQGSAISVLIPARNEEANLRTALESLVVQDVPNMEVIVLDDHSTDGTAELARSFEQRVQVIAGSELPHGWTGKNWACQQLADAASGEILIFCDADVCWSAGGLAAVVDELVKSRGDLLSVWPTQVTITWSERLVVPLVAMVIFGYLPVLAVHHVPTAAFAAANGQCMAWHRSAYERIGGHRAVRRTVLEDVSLARLVKRAGLQLRNADGAGLISCRMYDGWASVRRGFAKSILAGYGGGVPLIAATLFHWAVFWWPWIWLIVGDRPAACLAAAGAGIAVRLVSAVATRQRIIDAFLLPVSVGLMTIVAFQSLYWHFVHGGPQWKGRKVAA